MGKKKERLFDTVRRLDTLDREIKDNMKDYADQKDQEDSVRINTLGELWNAIVDGADSFSIGGKLVDAILNQVKKSKGIKSFEAQIVDTQSKYPKEMRLTREELGWASKYLRQLAKVITRDPASMGEAGTVAVADIIKGMGFKNAGQTGAAKLAKQAMYRHKEKKKKSLKNSGPVQTASNKRVGTGTEGRMIKVPVTKGLPTQYNKYHNTGRGSKYYTNKVVTPNDTVTDYYTSKNV